MFKRAFVLSIILVVFTIGIFASTFTVSGKYVFLDAKSRPIRKSELEINKYGVMLITGETSKSQIENEDIVITAGYDTTLSIIDNDTDLTVYNAYGETSVKTEDILNMKIYTPVTLIEGEIDGEIFVRSTNNEEVMLNLSNSKVIIYDAIRGRYTTIAPDRGYNYFKAKILAIPAGEGKEEIEKFPLVPEAPTFKTVSPSISIP